MQNDSYTLFNSPSLFPPFPSLPSLPSLPLPFNPLPPSTNPPVTSAQASQGQQHEQEQHQQEQQQQPLPLVVSLNRVPELPEPAYATFPLSSSAYYPENVGFVANDRDISKVSDRPAPAPVDAPNLSCAEKVPSEVTFRDEATGALYVDVHGRPIAEGSFGAVHVVCCSKGDRMALKVPKPTARMEMVRKEACFLSRVQGHDNVVKFHGIVEDRRGPCLLMQLYQPRDFDALLINRAPLSVAEIRFFGRQLVAGLSYIHEAGIRHCDLKPENVLVDKGMQLKITDLGLAEESSARRRRAGTPGFWAPEVLERKIHTDKIDVFSLGIMFYMMFARARPNITTGKVVIRPPDDYLEGVAPSEDAKDLLTRTLAIEVNKRIKLPDLVKHDFLCRGFCPLSLPDTAFDEAPVFDNTHAEKHARNSDSNGESLAALTRKKARAEESEVRGQESGATAKGKEVVRWGRVGTKSRTETNADATTKGHSTRTRNIEETQKIATTTTLGAQAYRVYVAKEAVAERNWATLLAQVQAQIEKERRDLHAERDELRDLFESDFRDVGHGSRDGNHNEDDGDGADVVQCSSPSASEVDDDSVDTRLDSDSEAAADSTLENCSDSGVEGGFDSGSDSGSDAEAYSSSSSDAEDDLRSDNEADSGADL